jgi:hypothetical protein
VRADGVRHQGQQPADPGAGTNLFFFSPLIRFCPFFAENSVASIVFFPFFSTVFI